MHSAACPVLGLAEMASPGRPQGSQPKLALTIGALTVGRPQLLLLFIPCTHSPEKASRGARSTSGQKGKTRTREPRGVGLAHRLGRRGCVQACPFCESRTPEGGGAGSWDNFMLLCVSLGQASQPDCHDPRAQLAQLLGACVLMVQCFVFSLAVAWPCPL